MRIKFSFWLNVQLGTTPRANVTITNVTKIAVYILITVSLFVFSKKIGRGGGWSYYFCKNGPPSKLLNLGPIQI